MLNTQPTADVTIALSSSDTTEGTVSPASLTFTPATWNIPQTVTVTGVDDLVDDGDIAYTIVTAPATSADAAYNGLDAADVAVTNIDNDTAGITVTPTAGLTTTEAGGTATFTVRLERAADGGRHDRSEQLRHDRGDRLRRPSLTFTPANWNTPQTVTVTGVDDAVDDGDIAYTIVTGAGHEHRPGYNGLNAADVAVTNIDNDTAGITVTPTSGLDTTEAGGTATFTVVLDSAADRGRHHRPDQLSDTTEGTVAPASADLHPGQLERAADGHRHRRRRRWSTTATSPTPSSPRRPPAPTRLQRPQRRRRGGDQHRQRHAPASRSRPRRGLTTTEAGGTATFTVVLNTQPTADVTIALSSSDTDRGDGRAASADLHRRPTGTSRRP